MKSKDIMLIAVVGIVSAVISIIFSNLFLTPEKGRSQQVEVVEPIKAELERPPADYFNENSLNPTKTIEIRQDPDSKPFSEQ